ncbi:hypothetical protein BVC80_1543g166 [Macleaya cordata]|uniref:Uncharacterized protein n=1 Tax=Macleaya cordata TaxID=56857 RepID=A0A200R216_MACCD|nr:hypothetical protein BVC80_1543g166 [Macleaya cordata]
MEIDGSKIGNNGYVDENGRDEIGGDDEHKENDFLVEATEKMKEPEVGMMFDTIDEEMTEMSNWWYLHVLDQANQRALQEIPSICIQLPKQIARLGLGLIYYMMESGR